MTLHFNLLASPDHVVKQKSFTITVDELVGKEDDLPFNARI